ncbi:hypothetical protein C8R48DRAFT_721897 [Suillus tomentosus]|nr:hypothetical protein C8R48DRAFT_721897 [Suillus tomentosus]
MLDSASSCCMTRMSRCTGRQDSEIQESRDLLFGPVLHAVVAGAVLTPHDNGYVPCRLDRTVRYRVHYPNGQKLQTKKTTGSST